MGCGASAAKPDPQGPELIAAVEAGDDAKANELLGGELAKDKDGDPTIFQCRNGTGDTALMIAICKGKTDLAKQMLEKGASWYAGDAAVHLAASMGNIEALKALKEKGADLRGRARYGLEGRLKYDSEAVVTLWVSALEAAAHNGSAECVKYLSDNHKYKDDEKIAALLHASGGGNVPLGQPSPFDNGGPDPIIPDKFQDSFPARCECIKACLEFKLTKDSNSADMPQAKDGKILPDAVLYLGDGSSILTTSPLVEAATAGNLAAAQLLVGAGAVKDKVPLIRAAQPANQAKPAPKEAAAAYVEKLKKIGADAKLIEEAQKTADFLAS